MPSARKRKKTGAPRKGRARTSSRKTAKSRAPARKARAKTPAKPAKKAAAPAPVTSPAKAAPARAPQTKGSPPAWADAAATVAALAASSKPAPKPAAPASTKKSHRKTPVAQRRGPGGELLAPGEILLPGGPHTPEEVQYLLRGCVAAERPAVEAGINEILTKRPVPPSDAERAEIHRQAELLTQRFESGTIEPLLPTRPVANRRNFASVVDRAKLRRREIGAFLRGLHLGRTETSHMDSHGEDSLQKLMEWAARLENLVEAEEPEQADYSQFHRGLDHLENTTEAFIVDVELTLRRLRDRVRAT